MELDEIDQLCNFAITPQLFNYVQFHKSKITKLFENFVEILNKIPRHSLPKEQLLTVKAQDLFALTSLDGATTLSIVTLNITIFSIIINKM